MRKRILSIILLLVLVVSVTACGSKKDLAEIAKKFNDSETVKTYKDYGYELNASATKDTLTISSKTEEKKSKVEFKLEGNILSNENLSVNDLMATLLVIDSVGQTHGYKDGELSKNINTFSDDVKKYTLDKEGIELVLNDEKVSLKIDISKKIPLINMDKFYMTADDFDMVSQIIADHENGNQNGKTGNIAYDIFIGDKESTIQIGQDKKLSDSAYKSIISALEVMYGKDVAKHFQEIYPKFVDGKTTVEAFTIETNYKVEDQDESVFKDTKVVLITINNKKLK
ncbi:MAG: hypothetical protein IJ574_00425 [Bacilli bacterium]|nr:hypothetical protein [Bacilli bacterium]